MSLRTETNSYRQIQSVHSSCCILISKLSSHSFLTWIQVILIKAWDFSMAGQFILRVRYKMTQQLGVGVMKRKGLWTSVWLRVRIFTLTVKKREQYYNSTTVRIECPSSVFYFPLVGGCMLPLNPSIMEICDVYGFWKALYKQRLEGMQNVCLMHAAHGESWHECTEFILHCELCICDTNPKAWPWGFNS